MALKAFVYPTGGQGPQYSNPYVQNMKEALSCYFDMLQPEYKLKLPRMLVFLLNSYKADVYVLNWIEDSGADRAGLAGALMSLFALFLIKLRRAKIVWVFHNIHPHGGETFWSRLFKRILFNYSYIVVAHSVEAAEYAKRFAKGHVYFKNHPIKLINYDKWERELKKCDFFFWSDVLSYKGLKEFLSNPLCAKSGRRIVAIGRCKDQCLSDEIEKLTNKNVIYENRMPDFNEVAAQCRIAKYVIFPYIGDSISSSGVLMDTLMMGGIPVGPNRGAFADLSKQGCCIVYNHIDEVFSLPVDDDHRVYLEQEKVNEFISNNTWSSFGNWLFEALS